MARTRRWIPIGRHIWATVLRVLLWVLVKIEVQHVELVPASGAGIVFYNHIHWLDPVIVNHTLRRYAVPLAKIETSSWPVVGRLLRWYHVIFIKRGVVDRTALQATWKVLADGHVTVISPEGTRSPDGRLQKAKEGLTFVARQAPNAWLIPCAVTGTRAFHWSLRTVLHHPTVTLRFGQPFRLLWPERPSREVLREMADEAMVQLAQLLPPELRGSYADADPGQHRWLELLDV
jgi:1-acyl-sn-glycerol-3-phosphate acyltransferase